MITHWIKSKDGREWPIRFSQSVTMQLAVDENVPANQISKFLSEFGSWPMGRVYKFYRLAFRAGARKENREFLMNDEDFIEWVSDDETIMEQIIKVMTASSPDPDTKKKAVRS